MTATDTADTLCKILSITVADCIITNVQVRRLPVVCLQARLQQTSVASWRRRSPPLQYNINKAAVVIGLLRSEYGAWRYPLSSMHYGESVKWYQSYQRGAQAWNAFDRFFSEDIRARSTSFGCCSFRVCGPTIWNKLPQDLRSTDTREQFKCRLKGWLFECAYGRRRVW